MDRGDEGVSCFSVSLSLPASRFAHKGNFFNSQFGQPGQYDFANMDIGRMRDKAKELEESQKGMKKKGLNKKVLDMIDR